jgi:hypothetical protein
MRVTSPGKVLWNKGRLVFGEGEIAMQQNTHIDGIYASWMKKVLGLVGNEALLADALNVSVTDLRRWANGEEVPPRAAFAKVVSIGSRRATTAV